MKSLYGSITRSAVSCLSNVTFTMVYLQVAFVAGHGNARLAALRPERRDDVGRPRSAVEAAADGLPVLPPAGPSSGARCSPRSHRQNDSELCVAAQHARVCLGRSLERVGLDH